MFFTSSNRLPTHCWLHRTILAFFFYVQLIRSFLKGVKRYLAILFFRSNFHYISFSLTFKNDFALFHVACVLAAGVSKHTAVPQDEIRLTLHVIKQRTQIFAEEIWPCRREQMPPIPRQLPVASELRPETYRFAAASVQQGGRASSELRSCGGLMGVQAMTLSG